MIDIQQLFNALGEPVASLNLSGEVIFATPELENWTGTQGRYAFANTLRAEDKRRFEQAFKRVAEGKTISTVVELMMAENGGTNSIDDVFLPVEIKLAGVNSALGSGGEKKGGLPRAVAMWLRDISEVRAQEALATVQASHLLDLIENMSDACLIDDSEGNIDVVNAAFCELFDVRVAPQSLIGTSVEKLFSRAAAKVVQAMGPKPAVQKIGKKNKPSVADFAPQHFEFTLLDGRHIHQTCLAVANEGVHAGRLYIFKHSVAGNGQALGSNAGLEAKPPTATLSAQMRSFEAIARDIAATIEGASSAIYRAEQLELPNTLVDNLKQIEKTAHAAFANVADLLDFSKIEGGSLTLDTHVFGLRYSCASLLDSVMMFAEERRLQMKIRVETDIPERLEGDGVRLMLTLRNLFECGIAHIDPATSDGSAEVQFTISPEFVADGNAHLAFVVEHSNPRFGVAGARVTRALPPAALMKLAVAKQIIKAMGGQLEVKERGDTTSYSFTAQFVIKPPLVVPSRSAYITLTGLPVLIVSPDADQRKMLADQCRSWRMHPRETDNGTTALQFLMRMHHEKTPIPLVILSNQLPVQDGFMLAFRLKNHHKLAPMAMIMVASDGKPGDAIACRENGINAYLRHPATPTQLSDAMSAVLGARETEDAAKPNLVTRHTLRESSAGSVLLIDADREQTRLAALALKRKNYRVTLAETAAEAFNALEQDMFDAVIVDPATPGFPKDTPAAALLCARMQSGAMLTPVLLAQIEGGEWDANEFSGFVKKPYNKDSLPGMIGAFLSGAKTL